MLTSGQVWRLSRTPAAAPREPYIYVHTPDNHVDLRASVASVTNARRGSTRTSAFTRADTRAQQNRHRSERARGVSLRQDHGVAEDGAVYTMMHADTGDKIYKSPVSVCLYVSVSVGVRGCHLRLNPKPKP
jgi:hypothetical protein